MQTTVLLKKNPSKNAIRGGETTANPLRRKAVGEEEDALQMKQNPLQLQTGLDEEEEPLQMKQTPVQRMDGLEDEDKELLQKKENPLQLKRRDQNPLQLKQIAGSPMQLQTEATAAPQSKKNDTGLPDNLKAGVEALSGYSMDDVKVHYNSDKPAQLQALAYAQGTDIYVSPGQEKHLPHEAWHVVQQKQGRVQPTVQMKQGIAINDDKGLENEADIMGQTAANSYQESPMQLRQMLPATENTAMQFALTTDADILKQKTNNFNWTSFRGDRIDYDDGSAKEKGRGAKVQSGNVMKTKVEWEAEDAISGEGTSMSSIIGPDHNLGSTPSATNAMNRVRAFKILTGETYIAGHLMNEKLGGPGSDSRNLTAISGSANTLQSSNIEKYVRDPVNEKGNWMSYTVFVNYSDDTRIVASDDQNFDTLKEAAGIGAKGITLKKSGKNQYQFSVRYASQLTANWSLLDEDKESASRTSNVSVRIDSPLKSVRKANITPLKMSGKISGKQAAVTTILAEELVLTKSDLLKHIVNSRAPLALRIQQLKDNIEVLQENASEAQEAYDFLVEQAVALAPEAGFNDGYNKILADHNFSANLKKLDTIDDPNYADAYKNGLIEGTNAGNLFMNGYYEGRQQGWNDDPKQYQNNNTFYKNGYEIGYNEGLASGDYSSGKRYIFGGVALLGNIYEYNQNVFLHMRGTTTLELTGQWFKQPNNLTWYEVRILTVSDQENYGHMLYQTAWVKRRWLNKGF